MEDIIYTSSLIDTTTIGINRKLARRYNAILKFMNKDTLLENGCLAAKIKKVQYVREITSNTSFNTLDCIEIVTTSTDSTEIYSVYDTQNIRIDRKYNTLEYGNYVKVI